MLPHRLVGAPTPNQNNAITSLVQARFGNGIIFLVRLRRWRWENGQHKPFIKVSVKPFQRLAGSKGRALVALARAKFPFGISFGYFSLGLLPSKKSNNKRSNITSPRRLLHRCLRRFYKHFFLQVFARKFSKTF